MNHDGFYPLIDAIFSEMNAKDWKFKMKLAKSVVQRQGTNFVPPTLFGWQPFSLHFAFYIGKIRLNTYYTKIFVHK